MWGRKGQDNDAEAGTESGSGKDAGIVFRTVQMNGLKIAEDDALGGPGEAFYRLR